MQQLKTFTVTLQHDGKPFTFSVNERDTDDSLFYDIFYNGSYLMSISPSGEILFRGDAELPDKLSVDNLVAEIKKAI